MRYMRITCYSSSAANMGYIYFMPPENTSSPMKKYKDDIELSSYKILHIENNNTAAKLEKIKILSGNLKDHLNGGEIEAEYAIDFNKEGYISGYELTLSPVRFKQLIRKEAFKVYNLGWKNREYNLITFDEDEYVFNDKNVIIKTSDKEDCFVIAYLEDPQKAGYIMTSNLINKIIQIKAFISGRNDLYPLEYLLESEFYIKYDA